MFTGLIEEIGRVKAISKGARASVLTISASKVLSDVKLGDSISTNGVCLTVVSFTKDTFTADVMPETMKRSNLDRLKSGDAVNLERALRLGDRLGGHLVSGHIDGMGQVKNIDEDENAIWLTVEAAPMMMQYIIEKGSVALDGISLTVATASLSDFKVSIIPHTKDVTTLHAKNVGDWINIECDMLGKYIARAEQFKGMAEDHKKLNLAFLRENGFLD